ncbi:LysM peptidoglycan-binding domain-containing protein [Lewinella sp. W8]|uniref:LysM peptidoglycan-binding domain-containing protein n=1 Tax=Lewinella sp. W8 TaxID=2528208 RepID=UPI001067CB38|nr:LysM peptidoglycan-binding domain-containing protein [Lewinella sp. W8]MTB52547.1 LysM peptidoglycan-binding domain-containing protein [Lewinella sp. W8]
MKSLIYLVALLLLGAGNLHAEQLFVLFDGNCGDRIRYEQSVAQQPNIDYFAYTFRLTGGDKLILETGNEGTTVQNYLPQGYVYCGDQRLDANLVARVNSGEDRVFILLPTNSGQYLIQPVVMAASLQRVGKTLSYNSSLTAFQFNSENSIIGVNLSYNDNGAKVYFEGREESPCSGFYLFRQLNPRTSYPVIDYKVAPELGLMERRLGSDNSSTTGGTIIAKAVNGYPVLNYLYNLCGATPTAATPSPQPYGTPGTYNAPQSYNAPEPYVPASPQTVTPQPQVQPQPESAAYAAANAPQPVIVNHTVSKGETLYAISRKYGTSVDAIRAQNGMTGSTVYVNQSLQVPTLQQVQAPTTATLSTPAPKAVSPSPAAPTTYGSGTPAAPVAYGSDVASRGEAVYGENLHIVQPGETVASVALKYGFTSAKFREMNDLGASEVIKVGQRLKIDDCNCPPPTVAAPEAYNTTPAAPEPYQPTAPAPQPYRPATPTVGTATPALTTSPKAPTATTGVPLNQPRTYGSAPSLATPAEVTTPAERPTVINNSPNFGQVVTDAAAPPTATMGTLESRPQPTNSTPSPTTYGSYPAPPTSAAPASAPTTYNATPIPTDPNVMGTPVGANINYSTPAQPTNRSFHLVQEGDSLFSISRRYGLTVDELRALNNMKPSDVIVPFQKLYIN